MRMLLFFDLPTDTFKQKRDYRLFRKALINDGFYMLQESVYCKMVINRSNADLTKARVKKICPIEGNVMLLCITEKQFASIELLCGSFDSKVISSEDRLIIL
ncbi:MAG: CRISPR-associated endonuclease Cas2 [Clostridia bacterium]|nr:CRISPR-associated endonuclease Cas2 [Clostridia bacterium]